MSEQDDQARSEQIAVLALADGAVFTGRPFGAVAALADGRRGEVVFATPMTGYQEICTDPSYRGQMVVLTYPLVGNYGVASEDVESSRPWLSALLVREYCEEYSNWRASESLDAYLARMGIPAVADLDTRALARHLRDHGTQRGILRAFPADAVPDTAVLLAEARAVRSVGELDVVAEVSLPSGTSRAWAEPPAGTPDGNRPRVVVIDTGYKENIARCLHERRLDVVLASHDVSLAALLALRPDGVLLANGPGDPEAVAGLVRLVRELIARHRVPVMGICLGHQLLGLAIGASTSRLPFGHHGANHPVIERRTGRVTITSQNHNFQVDEVTIPAESGFRVSHANLSDGSVEGLEHATRPIFSVQYHPEACPGPHDDRQLFDRFAAHIADYVRERAGTEAVLLAR